MDQLNGAGQTGETVQFSIQCLSCCQDQDRSDPLPTREDTVAHGFVKDRRSRMGGREEIVQMAVDELFLSLEIAVDGKIFFQPDSRAFSQD